MLQPPLGSGGALQLLSSLASPQPHGDPCMVDIPRSGVSTATCPKIHPSPFGLCSNIQASAPRALYHRISPLNLTRPALEHVLSWCGYDGCAPSTFTPWSSNSPAVAPQPLSLPNRNLGDVLGISLPSSPNISKSSSLSFLDVEARSKSTPWHCLSTGFHLV